jgi:CheY-like chemotaxis protein
LVAADDIRRANIRQFIEARDLEIFDAATAGEAMKILKQQHPDSVIIDLRLPGVPAIQLVEEMRAAAVDSVPLPIVVYGKRKLTSKEEIEVQRLQRDMTLRHAQSREALLHLTALLLHRADVDLSDEQRDILARVRRNDSALVGKKVLVIDDDLRNIFALTSVLEQHELHVFHAENGRAGIEILRNTPEVDAVLMDVMMPEMDGYETTRAIRQIPEFRSLPIIALTAKAMKGDREKCLQAGASDYVTKPVDLEHLFSVLRVWISRNHEWSRSVAIDTIASGKAMRIN